MNRAPGNLQLSTYFRLLLLTTDGEEIVVDHAVVAVGLEPNTDLAKSSGLELDDKLGGFRHVFIVLMLKTTSKLANIMMIYVKKTSFMCVEGCVNTPCVFLMNLDSWSALPKVAPALLVKIL